MMTRCSSVIVLLTLTLTYGVDGLSTTNEGQMDKLASTAMIPNAAEDAKGTTPEKESQFIEMNMDNMLQTKLERGDTMNLQTVMRIGTKNNKIVYQYIEGDSFQCETLKEGENEGSGEFAVVLLNWLRQTTLQTKILPCLSQYKRVKQIIVSHGKEDTYFETPDLPKVKHLKHWGYINEKWSVARRFVAAKESDYDCVLFQDDDLIVNEDWMNKVHDNYKSNPHVIHGFYGRSSKLYEDGVYTYECCEKPQKDKSILLTLTGYAFAAKQRAADMVQFVENQPLIREFITQETTNVAQGEDERRATPLWNGEDIFFNMFNIYTNQVLEKRTGTWGVFPKNPMNEDTVDDFGDTDTNVKKAAVSGGTRHYPYRRLALNFFISFFQARGVDFSPVIGREKGNAPWEDLEADRLSKWINKAKNNDKASLRILN